MKTVSLSLLCCLLCVMVSMTGCSSATYSKGFNGLTTPDGKPIAHLSTSNVAVHVLFKEPIWGDATLPTTVADFTQDALDIGGKKVDIVQSKSMVWWFVFPPISFFIHPVTSNVAGDVIE